MPPSLELFLMPGPNARGNTLADLYNVAFADAIELYIVSAYLTDWNSKLALGNQCTFKIVIGMDFGITRKKACRDVLKWLGPSRKDCFYIAQNIKGFHPKAIFWEDSKGRHHLLVGSSNLTKAAFNTNHEANIYTAISKADFEIAREWLDDIILNSAPVDYPWIRQYKESDPRRGGGRNTKILGKDPRLGGNNSSLITLLPRLPKKEWTQVLKQRRQQLREFSKRRSGLKRKILECARGKIGNERFYQYLKSTWDDKSRDTTSRFQGKGWERTGRHSNFSALCKGLINVFEADDPNRDRAVVNTINDLAKHRIPTRGALFSELLCQFFPDRYPVFDGPVRWWIKKIKLRGPHGMSEGARYNHLTQTLRSALSQSPKYPAKNLAELDTMIWKKHDLETVRLGP